MQIQDKAVLPEAVSIILLESRGNANRTRCLIKEIPLETELQHPSLIEDLSLKIEVRDQTI